MEQTATSRSCRFPLGSAVLLVLSWITGCRAVDSRPNIVFVLADDLGYNDVGYHGSVVQTPTLDHLAAEGVSLENYYVQQICTPSRSQLMSGRYQIHTGLEHGVIRPSKPSALPLDTPTMATVLRDAGYATHMVGKWHLGFFRPEYLPTNRGFDSFYGFLTGEEDHYTHTRNGYLDLRDNLKPVYNESGHYSTHLFTQKATDVIRAHDPKKGPLFLYLAYSAPHTPLQVPATYLQPYQNMTDQDRKVFAGMVTCMDEGIGNVTAVLKERGLWNNTVFVFSTDNGGQIRGASSNYPLRGGKGSLFEGGVRGVGFVTSPLLVTRGVVSKGFIHIADWFPTFVGLARTSVSHPLDGFDQWRMISENAPSPRRELLHNIDPLQNPVGDRLYPDRFDTRVQAAIRVGDWKLITGDAGRHRFWSAPRDGNETAMPDPGDEPEEEEEEEDKNVWLFNMARDPEERRDLSAIKPRKVKQLLTRLQHYQATAVEPLDPASDPEASPEHRDGVWGPWRGVWGWE